MNSLRTFAKKRALPSLFPLFSRSRTKRRAPGTLFSKSKIDYNLKRLSASPGEGRFCDLASAHGQDCREAGDHIAERSETMTK